MSAFRAVLARHRLISLGSLAVMIVLAWVWLLSGAGMGMDPAASWIPVGLAEDPMLAMMLPGNMPWTAAQFFVTFAMWWVMMIAMMLPSAAPMILLYARATPAMARPATESFTLGYLLLWGFFSLIATLAQWRLATMAMLSVMAMGTSSPPLAAALLIAAGVYQISPWKDACLRQCRNPAQFLSRRYRPGWAGALRMGALHGAWCVGCCWMLMILLFVGGIMNRAWIALLTLLVALEKLLPWGRAVSVTAGVGCILLGWAILLG